MKPTLGYASRTDAVQALREKGQTAREIAAAIGIDVKSVYALEASASRQERARERNGGRMSCDMPSVAVPADVLHRLRPHAARRDLSVPALVQSILEEVIESDLVDAVLDDRAARA